MMNKRQFVGFCLALLCVASCGDSGDTAGGVTSITYWRTLAGASGEAQDELVRRHNESTPTIQVTSEYQGTYSDLATKLVAATAARSGPDVTQLGTFEIRQFARSGALVDLRSYLDGEDGIDRTDWPATMAQAGEIDGGIYWLPFNVSVPVLYFNEQAFADARIDGAPKTWDAFFAAVRALTVREPDGTVRRHGLALWNITWPLFSMIWSEGGELTTRDYATITLNDPVVVRLLSELQELVREGAVVLPDRASGGHRGAFLNQRAAMILDSQDAFGEIFGADHGFTAGLAVYPSGSAGTVYAPGGGGLAMLATCPESKRAAAWSFIRFMLAPEQIAYYAKQTGYAAYSGRAQAAAGATLAEPRYAVIHSALPNIRADFSVNMSPAIRNAFNEAYQKILVDGASVQETLDAADAKAESGIQRELGGR